MITHQGCDNFSKNIYVCHVSPQLVQSKCYSKKSISRHVYFRHSYNKYHSKLVFTTMQYTADDKSLFLHKGVKQFMKQHSYFMLKIELANKDLSSKILSKGTLEPWQCYQLCCLAPADFGRSVNPIQTRGADYVHHITILQPRVQNPNTNPDLS